MERFLHVGFNFQRPPLVDELVPTFDQAEDWFRYAPNCWIVWTDEASRVWFDRLRPFLEEGENLLVCELDITNRQGWLPRAGWEWIKKDRTRPVRRKAS